MNALVVVVLLAPLLAAALAVVVGAQRDEGRWITLGCAVAGAGALVLLAAGEHPHAARLAPDELALAAVTGTALLAVGLPSRAVAPAIAAAMTVLTAGVMAGDATGPSTAGPILAIAVAGVLFVVVDGGRLDAVTIGAGTLACAAGVHAGHDRGAALVVAGAAALALCATRRPNTVVTLLLPAALVIGLRVAPQLTGTATARGTALALTALAAVGVVTRRMAPAGAIALWALAIACGPVPVGAGASRALAAGAVIVLVLGGPLATLAAVPGAALTAHALADAGGWPRAALALAAGVTVAAIALDRRVTVSEAPRVVDGVAVAAGAWLLTWPASWGWLHAGGMRAYTEATAVAAVALALAAFHQPHDSPWPLLLRANDARTTADGGRAGRVEVVAVAIVALTGLVAAALVRSTRL